MAPVSLSSLYHLTRLPLDTSRYMDCSPRDRGASCSYHICSRDSREYGVQLLQKEIEKLLFFSFSLRFCLNFTLRARFTHSGVLTISSLITDTDELYRDDKSLVLCLDKNAGYGYLAEFERVITDAEKVDETRILLLALIESLGYQELDQARLARMFDFYNQNWMEYYGTENVFTIE